MSEPRLSLVVSTIGRPDLLDRLVSSLERSDRVDELELVLVDQDRSRACTRMLERRATLLDWRSTTSGKGLSRGRNVGLGLARGDVVAFPDDDCWYAPSTVADVLQRLDAHPDVDGLCAVQVTAAGRPSMGRWLDRRVLVTRRNHHRTAISSGLFLRQRLLERTGPFDEELGAGASSWQLAGEESDLVLRAIRCGARLVFDPAVLVVQDDIRGSLEPGHIEKMLGYGCGFGFVWRRHHLPALHLGYLLARKAGAVAVRGSRGQRAAARADLAFLRGAVAGYVGRPPRKPRHA